MITFDDQNAFVNPLNDGDESDFTLYGNPTFPQKLIIGNILNNTAGIGSAYFDVWDPADTSTTETIGFHFIITEGTANLDTEVQTTWYSQANNVLSFRDDLQGAEFELYDTSGKLLRKQTIDGEITLDIHEQVNHFMMRVHSEGVVLKSRVSSYTK